MKKKVLAVVLGMSMVVAMMTGCGASKETSDSANSDEKTYTIGISQFAEHGSLDNCREGLEEGKNLKIVTNNADADTGTAAQIADQFVADKVDMICAIATPSAQAAYNAAMETDIPVVYTAVTNPVAAELANDDKSPVGNVTGTSDELPVEAQLKMQTLYTVLNNMKNWLTNMDSKLKKQVSQIHQKFSLQHLICSEK